MRTLLIITALMLSGCGSDQGASNQEAATTSPAQIQVQASPSPSPSGPVIVANNQVIANVISTGQWQGLEIAVLYIPSVDRYVEIYLTSGAYVGGNMQFSADGTGYADVTDYGAIGKNITYNAGAYYLSTAVAPTNFTVQTACDGGLCMNYPNPTTVDNSNEGWVSVETVSQPYDFISMAPLTIVYN